MKRKQAIAIIIVCVILVCTGLIGVRSAKVLNDLKQKSSETAQQNLGSLVGKSMDTISVPSGDYIGQLNIVGTIQDSDQITSYALTENQYNHSLYMKFVDQMMEDTNNKGIFLYVDSPGGTVYHSDELYLKLMEYKEKTNRPIYAYFANQACSGAYYISMAADKIYANRNCWTGSIGVIISLMNYEKMLDKVGVAEIDITSGKNKTIGSAAHPMTKEQKEILQSLVDEAYDQFTGIVADGRKMDIKKVKELADGRIYSALQAKESNLVDEIMGFEDTKEAVTASFGDAKPELFVPADNTGWKFIFGNLFNTANKFKQSSEIQAARDWIEQDESGVLMYYAK